MGKMARTFASHYSGLPISEKNWAAPLQMETALTFYADIVARAQARHKSPLLDPSCFLLLFCPKSGRVRGPVLRR